MWLLLIVQQKCSMSRSCKIQGQIKVNKIQGSIKVKDSYTELYARR